MPSVQFRSLILAGLFLVSATYMVVAGGQRSAPVHQSPTEDAHYEVENWSVGPPEVQMRDGIQHVTRTYHSAVGGSSATLALSTSPEAKRIYRAGPEVPFLGTGYEVTPAPASVVPPAPGRGALLARRGEQSWLQLNSYGERRGLLGNGPVAWGMTIVDTTFGRPNDYFLARIIVPIDRSETTAAQRAVALADTLFPRLAGWYAQRG